MQEGANALGRNIYGNQTHDIDLEMVGYVNANCMQLVITFANIEQEISQNRNENYYTHSISTLTSIFHRIVARRRSSCRVILGEAKLCAFRREGRLQ